MKVRMIYAHELKLKDEKEVRLLKVDEKHDLPNDVAAELIELGIAEPFPPKAKAPDEKKDEKK